MNPLRMSFPDGPGGTQVPGTTGLGAQVRRARGGTDRGAPAHGSPTGASWLRRLFARVDERLNPQRFTAFLAVVDPTPPIEGDEDDDEQPPAEPWRPRCVRCRTEIPGGLHCPDHIPTYVKGCP